ncbi:MAG: hypothetical protein Roseis2KO_44350 [Roseivirga sp.]
MNHIIKKQTLTIDMPPGYDTWRMQDSFKEVFNRDVLPRLEKVCDELGLDKRVSLKLDKLTIDTGTISSQELTGIWADQIENEFRKELLSRQQEKFDKEQVKSLTKSNQSELEAFIHFLEKGVLPWWMSDEFDLSPEQLLKQLLSEQPKELVSQISKSKSKSSISKRLLYQFESRQLKLLLTNFATPEMRKVLNNFQNICKRAFKAMPDPLQSALLATEIAISIDQNLIQNETEKLFEFLFTHLKNQQSGATSGGLTYVYKQLTYSNKERKIPLSLEEQKILSIALKVIARLTGLQEESKEKLAASTDQKKAATETDKTVIQTDTSHNESESFHNTDVQLKTRDASGEPEVKEQSSDSSPTIREHKNLPRKTRSAADKSNKQYAGLSQKSSDEQNILDSPSDSANTNSSMEEPLSAQDKRAWEHIERIKKLQFAKLNQENKDEVATDKPNVSHTSFIDNNQEHHRELPSPSQDSAPLQHKDQEAEVDPQAKPELAPNETDAITAAESGTEPIIKTEVTHQAKDAAEKSQPKGRKSAPQNKPEQKTAEGGQDHKKPLNLPEQEETQTKADNVEQHNAADNTGQVVPDQSKPVKPDQQADNSFQGDTTAPESLKEAQKATNKPEQEASDQTKPVKPDRQADNSFQGDTTAPESLKEAQKATNKPGQEASDQSKPVKSDLQVNKTVQGNTIAPESPEENQLMQGEDGNRAHQVNTSDKQAPTSTKAHEVGDHHSAELKGDNTGQPDSHSHVKQVSKKPDPHTLAYWQEELESIDECYIRNAGLILFWPYLGHFFKDMGLTTDGNFQSVHNQKQAALLSQYLLGPNPELHEYRLPLNKLLSGLKISEPVGKSIDLTEEDLTRCNNLLEAAIQNWSALRGTSVEGFQSSFLLRNGVLKRKDKHWLLQVEKMPFDMLMEQLPWPIGIVRLSWMNKPIYVEW